MWCKRLCKLTGKEVHSPSLSFRSAVAVDSVLLGHVTGLVGSGFRTFCGNVLLKCPRIMGHLFPTFRSKVRIRLLRNSALYPRRKGSSTHAVVKGGLISFCGEAKILKLQLKALRELSTIMWYSNGLMPHILEGKPSNHYGASPDINKDMRNVLKLPVACTMIWPKWATCWPPWSPYLILFEHFLWGFVKCEFYVLPAPNNLKHRARRAIAKIERPLL
jgi:hypothetical protein